MSPRPAGTVGKVSRTGWGRGKHGAYCRNISALPEITSQVEGEEMTGRTENRCDPVTLQIVRGSLRAIQSEMEAVIERTAMSPFIREKKDFYCALYDAMGRLVVGSNLPVFGDVV